METVIEPRRDGLRLGAGWAGIALCTAGFIAAVVASAAAMRELMVTSGGFCAIGGPYVIANECDESTFYLLFFGIIAALALAAVRGMVNTWVHGPRIGAFSTLGVLFGVYGWVFLDSALSPPSGRGTVIGWLICGILFWLMAAGFFLPTAWRAWDWLRAGGEPAPSLLGEPLVRATATVSAGPAQPQVAPPMGRDLTLVFLLATVAGVAAGIPLGLAAANSVI